jgi:hypothetical protein
LVGLLLVAHGVWCATPNPWCNVKNCAPRVILA